jgi:hypothetical protein
MAAMSRLPVATGTTAHAHSRHVAACLDPVILDLVLLSVEGTDDPRPLTERGEQLEGLVGGRPDHEAAAQLD